MAGVYNEGGLLVKTHLSDDPRIVFFDSIAASWDGWNDLKCLNDRFQRTFAAWAIAPTEHVLDVGCGTGNLSLALLRRLGSDGRVTALDLSLAMLEHARRKTEDTRVTWLRAAADALPLADTAFDRVLCFSAWPHFDRPDAVVQEWRRVLRPGGCAHVFHFASRETVNRIHRTACSPAVHDDVLVPVEELAELFVRGGFSILEAVDSSECYSLTAKKDV
jgi:ubiquinone/menaquinone biosynthesis C-methylase UbiE